MEEKKRRAVLSRHIKAEKMVHLQRVRAEREDLNDAVRRSRVSPEDFFFFEVDSMDSSKTLLPHWTRIPKTVDSSKLLKLHLTCVKYDGFRADDIYYYTNVLAHDASTTASIMWTTVFNVRLWLLC